MEWMKTKFLGAGSYGTVYLATRVNDHSFLSSSLVAVKSAHIRYSSTLRDECSFLKELRGEPNIVRCFGEDVSLDENYDFLYNLILEYAMGGTLLDLIHQYNSTMPESQIACYTFMLLRGIRAMHERDIVHCDLKPENVLVFPNLSLNNGVMINKNQLKIADFGLAKKESSTEHRSAGRDDGVIGCRGTWIYAAPECITSGLNLKASDIWSLGCIVWEMITGQPMCSCASTYEDLIRFARFGKITRDKIPPNLSEDLKDFLMRCLASNYDGRWSAEALMHHPFITKNLLICGDQIQLRDNEYSCCSWISTKGSFQISDGVGGCSSSSTTSSYQLFPDNKTTQDDSHQQHRIPCGSQLFDLLNNNNEDGVLEIC